MKRLSLTIALMLFVCLANVAQTRRSVGKRQASAKRVTSTRTIQKATPTIKKERKVGEDGFIWYEVTKNGLHGAEDVEGNILIPIKYDYIYYSCSSISGTHYFKVEKGDFKGAYTPNGHCVIPIDRHYTETFLSQNKGKFYFTVEKNKTGEGLLDARGNEVISTDRGYTSCLIITNAFGLSSIPVEKGDFHGLCDLNGNEIVPPNKYVGCFLDGKGNNICVKINKNSEYESIYRTVNQKTSFDYEPYGGMYYPFDESHTSSTVSSPSSNSNTQNSGNSTGKPTPTKPGLLYSGHYTQSAQGRNVTTGQFTDPIGGDYQMEVEIYEDYITINSVDTYKFVKMVNGKRKYSGSPSFQMAGMSTYSDYYVDGNYNITMNTTMSTAFGSDTFVYTITKGESTMPVYNNPSGGGNYSSGSNGGGSRRSSTTPNNRSTPRPNCAYCRGKGRVVHNSYQPMYGTRDYQVRCNECGGTFMKSSGHTHITCGHCGGTGKMK